MKCFTPFVVVAVLCGGCATDKVLTDLDNEIGVQKARLGQIAAQLNDKANAKIPVTNDLHAQVRYSPIRKWLDDISTPTYKVTIQGIAASGDIVYQGGVGKAWIEPVQDTKGDVQLRHVNLVGEPGGATWSGFLRAHAESRIKFEVFHIGGNVLCQGDFPERAVSGALRFGALGDNSVPYVISLTSPASINIRVSCGLGGLGNYTMELPLDNLTRELSKGAFELGIKADGTIDLPDKKVVYLVQPNAPEVVATPDGLAYKTNLDVKVTR